MVEKESIELEGLARLVSEFKNNEVYLNPNITFFEIAGFPSRENVFSNILKFYFDNRKKHEFRSVILKSLLSDIIENINDDDLNVVNIEREVVTNHLKRIDLVIETSMYLIGIENKVYHTLNNDLAEYAYFLKGKSSKKIILLVLNLKTDIYDPDKNGFRFISYKRFIENLESTVQFNDSNKYHIFLMEFIQNIKNHFPSTMTEAQIRFIAEYEMEIEGIKRLSSTAENYLSTRAAEILQLVKYGKEKWIEYRELSYSFELQTVGHEPRFRIACTFEITKIYIEIDCRDRNVLLKFLEEISRTSGSEKHILNHWIYVKEFVEIYKIQNYEIAKEIQKWIECVQVFSAKMINT